jgi:hypothetical protein
MDGRSRLTRGIANFTLVSTCGASETRLLHNSGQTDEIELTGIKN